MAYGEALLFGLEALLLLLVEVLELALLLVGAHLGRRRRLAARRHNVQRSFVHLATTALLLPQRLEEEALLVRLASHQVLLELGVEQRQVIEVLLLLAEHEMPLQVEEVAHMLAYDVAALLHLQALELPHGRLARPHQVVALEHGARVRVRQLLPMQLADASLLVGELGQLRQLELLLALDDLALLVLLERLAFLARHGDQVARGARLELALEHLELVLERLAFALHLLLLLGAHALHAELELGRLRLHAPLHLLLAVGGHVGQLGVELLEQLVALLLELDLERVALRLLLARLLDKLAAVLVEMALVLDEIALAVLGQLTGALLLLRYDRLGGRVRHRLAVDHECARDRLARSIAAQLLQRYGAGSSSSSSSGSTRWRL